MQPSALPYLCILVERVRPQTQDYTALENGLRALSARSSLGTQRSESTTGEGTFKLRPQGIEGPAPEGAERAGREFLSGEEQRPRA